MAAKHKLTARYITSAPIGKHGDGGGLWLIKRPDGGHQWVFKYTLNGKRKEMGLGGSTVSLKTARTLASEYQTLAKTGTDPKLHRDNLITKSNLDSTTLAKLTYETFEAKKPSLKGDGKNGRWLSPLTNHLLPKLGKQPISSITQHHIRDTLKPIWHTQHPTAVKVLSRLNIVFRHAAANDINVDLQAIEKAKLLLGMTAHTVEHIPSLPWIDTPKFYQSLDENRPTHLALKMTILTGSRSSPIRFMNIDQITNNCWLIQGDEMKGIKGRTNDFRIPLCDEALRIIELALLHERNGFLFVGPRGKPISDTSMEQIMKRRDMVERPHGFRSTFKSWAIDNDKASLDLIEACLGHVYESKVAQAYTRTDRFEQRLNLHRKWAEFLNTVRRQLG